ncbi:MAG: fasciclin domain-containing protein [Bacteroidetes bacterium]|nr:fasciclin domain-containing protein [Bacteroidota bacterium]
MKKPIFVVTALLAFCLSANSLFAQTAPAAAPAGSGDVVAAMTSSDTYNAFSLAVRAAGLSKQLEGAGPFTVFAPMNDAYAKTSSGHLDSLFSDPAAFATHMKTYIVNGKFTKADILAGLQKGPIKYTTIDNKTLTLSPVTVNGHTRLQVADDEGFKAQVGAFDLMGSNGVVHGLTGILAK